MPSSELSTTVASISCMVLKRRHVLSVVHGPADGFVLLDARYSALCLFLNGTGLLRFVFAGIFSKSVTLSDLSQFPQFLHEHFQPTTCSGAYTWTFGFSFPIYTSDVFQIFSAFIDSTPAGYAVRGYFAKLLAFFVSASLAPTISCTGNTCLNTGTSRLPIHGRNTRVLIFFIILATRTHKSLCLCQCRHCEKMY